MFSCRFHNYTYRLTDLEPRIVEDKTMANRVSKLPQGKKKLPINVVRTRLRNHLELVLASNNEVLIRMMEQFFSQMIARAVQERPKADVIPINREDKNDA